MAWVPAISLKGEDGADGEDGTQIVVDPENEELYPNGTVFFYTT